VVGMQRGASNMICHHVWMGEFAGDLMKLLL
jgi:hypothetical protein